MPCDPPCPEGCDLSCEVRATWTPEPGRVYSWPSGYRSGPGMRFAPDDSGGGTLSARSKTTMRWVVIARKKAHGA